MFAEFKQLGEANQADIREKAKEQNDALDAMYSEFKDLGTDTLDHIKEKWGELDAAEQKTIQDLKDLEQRDRVRTSTSRIRFLSFLRRDHRRHR